MSRAVPPQTWRRLGWLLVAILVGAPGLAAQDRTPLEYQVKAAYLLNFTRYVQWPAHLAPSESLPVSICVLGQDPFGPDLDAAVLGKTSHGHPVLVRRVDSVQGASGCHIVFVTRETWRDRRETILTLTSRGVLTVGDSEEFARGGGVIGFVLTNETVRFVVNLKARERSGLVISSRVLALATGLFEADGP